MVETEQVSPVTPRPLTDGDVVNGVLTFGGPGRSPDLKRFDAAVVTGLRWTTWVDAQVSLSNGSHVRRFTRLAGRGVIERRFVRFGETEPARWPTPEPGSISDSYRSRYERCSA